MAKSKYSPALFEVINKQRSTGKLGVPKWWKGLGGSGEDKDAKATVPAGGEQDAQPVDPQILAETESTESLEPAESRPGHFAEPDQLPAGSLVDAIEAAPVRAFAGSDELPKVQPPRPMAAAPAPGLFRLMAGRVQISLNPIQASVFGGILLIALIASFELGRGFGKGSSTAAGGPDALSAALKEKPNGAVLSSPGNVEVPPPRAGNAAVPAAKSSGTANAAVGGADQSGGLVPGRHYVVLDTYKRDHLKSAEHTRDWLLSAHKIETMVYSSMNKDTYVLITRAGFDYSTPGEKEKCEQLVEHFKALGPECRKELYKAELPVYNFKSPLIKKY